MLSLRQKPFILDSVTQVANAKKEEKYTLVKNAIYSIELGGNEKATAVERNRLSGRWVGQRQYVGAPV